MAKSERSPQFPDGIISVYAQLIGPADKRTIKMALDTGASYTMVPPEKILAIGHKVPVSEEKMKKVFTASGIEYVPITTVSLFKCLGITVKSLKVICHNLPPESPVEGLLGLNFLSRVPAFAEFYRKICSNHVILPL